MKLLHEVPRAQCAQYPGNIAVVDQAGSCSYAELDARAEAYAGLLVALGWGAESGSCSGRKSRWSCRR